MLPRVLARNILLAALAVSLPACGPLDGLFGKAPPKKVKVRAETTKTPDGAGFVENLSLARLSLSSGSADPAEAQAVQAYLARKKGKSEPLTLAVLDYKSKGGGMQKIVAPISRKNTRFPALRTVMNRLNETPYTVHDLRLVRTIAAPDTRVILPDDPAALRDALDAQQQRLLNAASPLPPLEDIKIQLALIRFFTDRKFKEAAYFAVDNVKRALAKATQDNAADEPSLKKLSDELQASENRLHQELPYRL